MKREELIKRRDELNERLAAIRRDLGGGLSRDMEDQSLQLENYDTLVEIARVAEQELADIERRLRRPDDSAERQGDQ